MTYPFLFSIAGESSQVSVHGADRLSRQARDPSFNAAGPVELVILDSARRWNEIWWPLASMLIVRDDVAVAMDTAGLRGLRWTKVNIVEMTECVSTPAPAYRCLLPQPGIKVDLSRIAFKDRDRATRGQSDPEAPHETRFVPMRDSWSGADVVICANHPTLYVWCTLRFLELARNSRWKGLRFCPMDVPSAAKITFNRGAGVNYLGKQWPPQWYPDGVMPAPENLEPPDPIDDRYLRTV